VGGGGGEQILQNNLLGQRKVAFCLTDSALHGSMVTRVL
jgi:hypothetical protein